ncbi:MAG: hypothetical protein ACO1OQ_07870 [Rufibacter sp.]
MPKISQQEEGQKLNVTNAPNFVTGGGRMGERAWFWDNFSG